MAAAYLFHIVMNHPFVDGNKRTGTMAALVFLDWNDLEVFAEPGESGQYNTIEELADAKKVGRTYASRVMRLTSLCPQIVESILNGNESDGLSLRQLHKGIHDCWKEQMELITS